MEDNTNLIETLLVRASQYGKTSYELIKLRTLHKVTDIVSTCIPNIIVIALMATLLLLFNLGLALWLGEILGKIYFGFFVVALFYGIIGLFLHFFMHNWIKKKVGNYIVKQALK